jgi:hypothetical protein
MTAEGRNTGVSVGRATCEARSATWNLCTNSAFAVGPSKHNGIS